MVFLATKPHVLPTVLQELRPAVTSQHLLISLAAGVSLQKLQRVGALLFLLFLLLPLALLPPSLLPNPPPQMTPITPH